MVNVGYAMLLQIHQREDIAGGRGLFNVGHLLALHVGHRLDPAIPPGKQVAVVGRAAVQIDRARQWHDVEFLESQRAGKRAKEGAVHLFGGKAFNDIAVAAQDGELHIDIGLLRQIVTQQREALLLLEDVHLRQHADHEFLSM